MASATAAVSAAAASEAEPGSRVRSAGQWGGGALAPPPHCLHREPVAYALTVENSHWDPETVTEIQSRVRSRILSPGLSRSPEVS